MPPVASATITSWPRKRRGARNRKPDHAGADDENLHCAYILPRVPDVLGRYNGGGEGGRFDRFLRHFGRAVGRIIESKSNLPL